MSLEITEVRYDADPKHIIIRSDTSVIDCGTPVSPDKWLDGTYGEVLCVYDLQFMNFEKRLCDSVLFDDVLLFFTFKHNMCTSCGVLNAPLCCLNTTPPNSYAVKDHGDNCIGNAQT